MLSNLRFALLPPGQDAGLTFPYWSLSLLQQFYLLLPLLVVLYRSRLAYVMGAFIAWQFLIPDGTIYTYTRPGSIAAGVLIAIWSAQPGYAIAEPRFLARSRLMRCVFMALTLILMGALSSGLGQPLHSVPLGLLSVLSGFLVYAASFERGYIPSSVPFGPISAWLGTRSYAVSVTHIPAFGMARELQWRFAPQPWGATNRLALLHLVMGIGLTLLLSELTYRFVEVPCRRYGRSVRVEADPIGP